jgi:hypothetical protein
LTTALSVEQGAPLAPSEVRTLTAPDGVSSAYFGSAVSVSGSFAAVGAYGMTSGRGAVYVFERNQGGADEWQLVRKITVSDGATSDHFGFSVSLSGSMLAVGAPDNNEYGSDAGLVYIFERNLGGADQWGLLCKVASANLSAGDHFGYSVSLDLNLLAVGAYGDKPNGVGTGAAYVFHMNKGSSWFGQVAQLQASDAASGDQFGIAVSVSGDRVLVGAHMDDNEHGTDAGGAYLFARDHGGLNNWGQVRKFTGESESDHYGRAVAIYGSALILGAPDSTEGGAFGRAYVYERNQGGADAWGWVKTLIGGTALGCKFGGAVALSHQRALVGASMEAAGGVMGGAVVVFGRDEAGWGNWGRETQLLAAGRAANDYFGAAVALDGNVAVVGAHGDDPSGSSSGSARLFRWTGNRWFFEAKLTNSHPAFPRSKDYFGSSVALNNGWLAAGAPRFAGDNNCSTYGAGAPTVTMFQRHPRGQVAPWSIGQNVWYEDLGDLDFFGTSVGLSEDTLVVGAPMDPTDDCRPRGMAHVFDRNQGGADAWGQVGRSNQHNRHDYEDVGRYVAIDGDTIVLGSSGIYRAEHSHWLNWYEYLDFWDDDMVYNGGNTYIYSHDSGGQSSAWTYLRRYELWALDQVPALSGNTLALAISSENAAGDHYDAVLIWGRQYGGKDAWGAVKLILQPRASSEPLGRAIALDGDTLVVGSLMRGVQDSSSAPEGGSVFIYKRNAGGADHWGLVREVKLSSAFGADGFGGMVALSGDLLAVGAVGQSNITGAVYLFERNNGGADMWGLVEQITPPQPWPEMWFGQSLALEHGVLAIGAPGHDVAQLSSTASILTPNAGAVYVFNLRNNHAPVMANPATNSLLYVDEDDTAGAASGNRVSSLAQRAQMADADGDPCGIAVIAADNTSGQWQYSVNGNDWFNLQVSPGMARVLDPKAWIRFLPSPNFNGLVQPGLTYRAWDQTVWGTGGSAYASTWGGNTPFSEETSYINCEVAPVNDRPAWTADDNVWMPSIYGNILSQYNHGLWVSNLIAGIVTDADTNACGIAVASIVNTYGDWQYSLDAGLTWRSFVAPSPSGARLLGPGNKVRFMPARDYNGTILSGMVFAAWDQTYGTGGGIASIQSSTSFSSQTLGCNITVTPVVNHAPVLDLFGEPRFPVIADGATTIEGARVSELLTNWVEDVDGDACGLALGQTDSTYGTWEYSLDDGANWLSVGEVSFEESLLLGPEARLRFLPVPDYAGTIQVAVLYRAWDQTSGVEGTKVNSEISGGSTSLSIGIELAPITVSSLANHAPVLASLSRVYLTSVHENDTDPFGDLISKLIGSVVTDADGDTCGVAIFASTINYGYWEYSLNKGVSWQNLGQVSTAAARLLGPNTPLRFIPATGFTGTVTNGLEFRAWDRSKGTNGGTRDLKLYGGSTPYSSRTGTIGITVEPLNHAPRLLASAVTMTLITEGQFNNPGDVVSNLLQHAVADADGNACGMAVLQVPDAPGAWQYSLDGGRTWTTMSTWRLNYARLLGPSAMVRFVPDSGYYGQITNGFLFAAWDQSTGLSGDTAFMPRTGGQTAYSTDSARVEIQVREANLPPIALTLTPASVPENKPTRTVVGVLEALDPNAGDSHTFALVSGSGDDDNTSFIVMSNLLATTRVFDRETRSDYMVRLQVRDAAGSSYARPVIIRIEDLNDSPPTSIALSPSSVAENQPIGTVVGTLTTSDPDLVGTYTYSLVSGGGGEDNAAFAVQGDKLVTTETFDFESKPVCYVRLQVDDGQNTPYIQSLPILVGDEEENTAPYHLTIAGTCLLDGSVSNTPVGVLKALDKNVGDTLTFTLVAGEGDDNNAAFKVTGQTLFTATNVDFSIRALYRVRVQADDGHGGTLQKVFNIVPAVPLWTERFEDGWGQWSHLAEQGNDGWQITTDAALSSTHSLSVAVEATPSDSSAVSPWIQVPSGVAQIRFEFHHQYDWGTALGESPDCGVLEWRNPEGAWLDVLHGEAGSSVIYGGYGATIDPAADHPVAGQRVWALQSGSGFTPFVASLNRGFAVGKSVQFRWRQVATSGTIARSWHIDDIVLGAVLSATNSGGFRILSCRRSGSQLDLEWESVPGQTYVIETSPVPGTGVWTQTGAPIPAEAAGDSTTKAVDLSVLPGFPQRELYFRVKGE